MRSLAVRVGILAMAVAGMGLPAMAQAQSVSIGVQTNNLQLGINFGPPPPLVAVPGPAPAVPGPTVYYAPSLPYNYFVYGNVYYLYPHEHWFRARHYNGPWTAIAITQVPRPILAVPVERYRDRPVRWAHHGPPPWAQERVHEHRWAEGHGRGHSRDEWYHDREHGKGRG
jgi:hypothetical protein